MSATHDPKSIINVFEKKKWVPVINTNQLSIVLLFKDSYLELMHETLCMRIYIHTSNQVSKKKLLALFVFQIPTG